LVGVGAEVVELVEIEAVVDVFVILGGDDALGVVELDAVELAVESIGPVGGRLAVQEGDEAAAAEVGGDGGAGELHEGRGEVGEGDVFVDFAVGRGDAAGPAGDTGDVVGFAEGGDAFA